jgi:hypothetical protein
MLVEDKDAKIAELEERIAAVVTSSLPVCDPFGNFPFGLMIKIPNGRLCLFSRRRVLPRMSAASLLLSWVSGGKVLKERGQRWAD